MCQTPQGVPIRLELGPKDMDNKTVMLARRDTGVKEGVIWDDVAARIPELLEQIQVKATLASPICRLLKKKATCVHCSMCTTRLRNQLYCRTP